MALPACEDSGGGGSEPTVTATNYVVPTDVRGEPYPEAVEAIDVTSRLGFAFNINTVHSLETTEGSESSTPAIISGRQIIESTSYVKARALRVESFYEPPGTKLVMVDVSLNGPLPLKSARGVSTDEFLPAPMLHDHLNRHYWPSGYVLETQRGGGKSYEIRMDPTNPLVSLRDIPPLSANKPQKLRLVFRVNDGVKITGFSYGGHEKKTFEVDVNDGR
jgi:hypothetical protein